MTQSQRDDLFYVCCLIELIGRVTKNRRKDVVNAIGADEIKRQVHLAEVNHCLSMEEVTDELIEYCQIQPGQFDTVEACKYKVPSVTAIGKTYRDLILDVMGDRDVVSVLMEVFSSFLSDEISDFNTSAYYSNPSYLKNSYEAGRLLD